MSDVKRIRAPFDEATARSLRAGDRVLITGTIIAARDAAHKRLVEALDRGEELPVDLDGAVIYYVGPSPARPGRAIGAAGPTTAGRMDAYTPTLLAQGLRGMIGKGYRKPDVVEAMQRHGVPYLAAVGGAGALISQRIKKYTVLAYPDLGPEAVAALDLPEDGVLSASFLGSVLLDLTGRAGESPWFDFLSSLRRIAPVVQKKTYILADGSVLPQRILNEQTDESSMELKDAVRKWRCWSYYKLKYADVG